MISIENAWLIALVALVIGFAIGIRTEESNHAEYHDNEPEDETDNDKTL